MDQYSVVIATSWNEGAVSSHFRELACELARRGFRVVLLVDGRKQNGSLSVEGVDVRGWPSLRPVHLRDAIFYFGLLRSVRPLCTVSNFGATTLMSVLGRFLGVPVRIAWYHTLQRQLNLDSRLSRPHVSFLRARRRLVHRCTTYVAANSVAAAEDAMTELRISPHRVRTFNNSLADPFTAFGLTLRSSHAPGARIVCAGRFSHSKGQDVLVKAIPKLVASMPNVSVTFIGDGETRQRCEELAVELGVSSRCRFVGAAAPKDVLASMAMADVVVVPSRDEAFGLVNIEAMAVSVPVVASRVGGIPEIVRHGVDGYLVPPDNPEELASALQSVLSDSQRARALGANGRARFLSMFERSVVVRQQADWIESLLHRSDSE